MKKKLISINVTTGPYQSFVDDIISKARQRISAYVCVANVHMLAEAHKSEAFAAVVNQADIVTPDGKPLTWAFRLLYGIKQDRVAGMDLLPDLLSVSEKQQLPVAFYGGSPAMIDAAKKYLDTNYKAIQVPYMYSPPFRALTEEEEKTIIKEINDSGAAIVFVVLGCPKQEKWMASMKGKINAIMIGIGGAVPVLAGLQKRAPRWMQNAGLEWLFRLAQEPKRLFKRYASTNSLFIYLLLKEKFRIRNSKIKIQNPTI